MVAALAALTVGACGGDGTTVSVRSLPDSPDVSTASR